MDVANHVSVRKISAWFVSVVWYAWVFAEAEKQKQKECMLDGEDSGRFNISF